MCLKDLELACFALDDTIANMNIFFFIYGLTKEILNLLVKEKA